MPAHHQLRCLGEPGLFTIGGRPVKLRTRKQLALLCYLAMEQRTHTRDSLAELLWPKVSHSEARHSLATAISGLRGKLGKEAFESTGERLRLRPGVVDLDVDRLLRGEVLASEFEVALDVDGFLQSFDLEDALPFSHWRDGEHARLLPNVRDALVVLMDNCRRTGDFRQIETLALRLLRFDSLSEEAIRARMEARAFAGDRLTALRLFKEWKAALGRSLGAVPSPLLEGMALRLRRREWERPEAPDVPAVRTDQWRGRPFVGRGVEYRQLYEAWEGTQRGAARHRLLLGDSGIGKSTLVERLTTAAGLEGATVARVQCHEVEREIPYAMVSGLIAQLVERPGSSGTPPDALAELAQTIPAVRARFAVLPPPLESQGDAARIRFTEAAHALMAAVAEEHPVILVVDDVHHADDVSLAVLHRIVRLADRQRILMLFLARPGELYQSPQAARLRDNGASLGIHPLEVVPLAEDDSRTFLDLLVTELQLSPSATVRRALLSAAAGSPLVLELLVRDWARSGAQCLALSLDAVTADAGRKSEPDEAYQLLLDRLVRALDPSTRNTLQMAAVLGPRLNDSALYALADLRVNEVMTGLTALVQNRILRDGGDHLEFSNDLVRAHSYYAVPAPMRMLLHGLIADALLVRAAQGDDSLGLELAWHCMRCGRREEAAKQLLLGGRASIRRGAVHEAERRLESGLSSLPDESLIEARLLLVELLQEQGRWKESAALLSGFAEESKTPDGICLAGRACVEVFSITRSEAADLAAHANRHIADASAAPQTRLRALRLAGALVCAVPEHDLAKSFLESASKSRPCNWSSDEELEWDTQLVYLGHYTQKETEESEHTFDQLVRMAERAQARTIANARSYRIVSGLALCHRRAGRYPEAIREYETALGILSRLGRSFSISIVHAHLAACHRELGQIDKQKIHGERALALSETADYSRLLAIYCAAEARHLDGDRAGAEKLIEEQQRMIEAQLQGYLLQAWVAFRADLLWLAGHREQAGVLAQRAIDIAANAPLSRSNVGSIGRWVAVLSMAGKSQLPTTIAEVRTVQGSTWWDEAQRLSALSVLAGPSSNPSHAARLNAALQRLPAAFKTHLVRYGL